MFLFIYVKLFSADKEFPSFVFWPPQLSRTEGCMVSSVCFSVSGSCYRKAPTDQSAKNFTLNKLPPVD